MSSFEQEAMTQRLFAFLEEHNALNEGSISPELLEEFNRQELSRRQSPHETTAAEYLQMAQAERDPNKAIGYVNKALKLEPDNYDAIAMKILLKRDRPEDTLSKLAAAVEKATEEMKAKKFIPQCVGDFWGLMGTRPYMRLLETYADLLKAQGMFRKAAERYEEMMVLNPGDNQGVRYSLMQCYCMLEETEKAMVLYGNSREHWLEEGEPIQDLNHYSKVPEFRKAVSRESNDAALVLPLAILFYKQQDFEKAGHCMKILMNANSGTLKYFRMIQKLPQELPAETDLSIGYRPFTFDEYAAYYDDMYVLYATVQSFPSWALAQIDPKKKKR